jgi:probable HAF family extracellular repeat protein
MRGPALLSSACLLVCGLLVSGCRHDGGDSGSASARGTFSALGALPGDVSSEAAGVSFDGGVVVGTSTSAAGARRAFRWSRPQGMTALGLLPGGTFSSAKAVSADGAVVTVDADQGSPAATRAARWTVDTGLVALPPLRDSPLCAAAGASGDGRTIVGTCLLSGSEAFAWTAQSATVSLGRLGAGSSASSSASAVSADAHVIAGAGHPVLAGAALWVDGAPMLIGGLPGDTGGVATALSTDGRAAAGASRNPQGLDRAFRWTASAGIEALDQTSASVETFAAGMSGDGRRVVGWATLASQADTALVWIDRGVHDIADLLAPDARAVFERWSQTRARAISQDGRTIVGKGVSPDGTMQGWMVQLPD